MMHDEVVVRRRWVSEQEFLDAFGATSVLPGPGSTQLSIYLGRRRAGWAGLVVAGLCFITPAMLLVLALAWAYQRYGSTPSGAGLLYGIKPVVIAVIAGAVVGLGRTAVKGTTTTIVAGAAIVAYLAGANVLIVLLGAGAFTALLMNRSRLWPPGGASGAGASAIFLLAAPAISATDTARPHRVAPGLRQVFFEFLKLGTVVFGSGYVLLAFLRRDLVHGHAWISSPQLLDAVSVGQLTPGPVFTTATFIGYLVAGVPGAVLATVGIFLPSFLLVAAVGPLITRWRASPWAAGVLDGFNAAAIGVMAGVVWDLGHTAVVDPLTGLLAAAAFLLLARWRVNSVWLIAGGALVGLLHAAI
jgi:chromate transporter